MKVLHINSYYFTNKIHYQFRKQVEKTIIKNRYFIPIYKGAKRVFNDVEVQYFQIYKKYDKLFFFTKIIKSILLIKRENIIEGMDAVYAHTLISDGLIAFLLKKMFGIPYVVTIRNTDINFFLPNILFRYLGKLILKDASKIICVSFAYKRKLIKVYPFIRAEDVDIVSNGVDQFWLNNLFSERQVKQNLGAAIKLLFVGRLDKNKNIKLLLDFIRTYSDRKYRLTVVGENIQNINFAEFNSSLDNGNSVEYLGVINDINRLSEVYRENQIYVMVSINETFGVSYIEALSQGVPILYTRGEGVDGFFEERPVGKECDPFSLASLKDGVDYVAENYSYLVLNGLKEAEKFNWSNLSVEYERLIMSL